MRSFRHWRGRVFDVLVVAVAVAALVEIVLADLPRARLLMPAVVLYTLPLLLRDRWPFAMPVLVIVVQVLVSFLDAPGGARENWGVVDACKRLADAGADVVGLNCIRGPATMMPLLREIRAAVRTHIAALPVPYRTSEREPSFQSLRDAHWHYEEGSRPFPVALDPFTCNRFEIAEFGREALAMDIRYLGVCCGAGPHHIRALAEAVGKRPPASKYSADMSKHAFLGSHERIPQIQKDYADKL